MAKWKLPKIKYDKDGKMRRTTKGPRPRSKKSRRGPIDPTLASTSATTTGCFEPRIQCRIMARGLQYRVKDLSEDANKLKYESGLIIRSCDQYEKKLSSLASFLKGVQPNRPWAP